MSIEAMKSYLHLLVCLAVLGGSILSASAQTIKNSSYQTIAQIRSDGTIQDGSYRTIGYIKSDGTVQDGSYRTIGYVKSNGTVQDASYRTIGHADGVPIKWTAYFFFFR